MEWVGQGFAGADLSDKRLDRRLLKTAACIPEQVADTAAEVQEKTPSACNKKNLSEGGADEPQRHAIGVRSDRRCNQPSDQTYRINSEGEPAQPMGEG